MIEGALAPKLPVPRTSGTARPQSARAPDTSALQKIGALLFAAMLGALAAAGFAIHHQLTAAPDRTPAMTDSR
jgi:hypothetical protein